MKPHVDCSVYPDEAPTTEFFTINQQADYVHRNVSAFDFGLAPDADTLHLFSEWLEVFDAFPLPASPGYHALRSYFGWPAVAKEPFPLEPSYLMQDSVEGRVDGYEELA
jgi:hypothetical protein